MRYKWWVWAGMWSGHCGCFICLVLGEGREKVDEKKTEWRVVTRAAWDATDQKTVFDCVVRLARRSDLPRKRWQIDAGIDDVVDRKV
jgi:hypothetical protein